MIDAITAPPAAIEHGGVDPRPTDAQSRPKGRSRCRLESCGLKLADDVLRCIAAVTAR
jgi:hypothetical protein